MKNWALILALALAAHGAIAQIGLSEKDDARQLTTRSEGSLSRLDQSKLLIANNRVKDAIGMLRELHSEQPDVPEHNYFLGVCLVRSSGNLEEAIKFLNAATEYYNSNDIDPGMGEPEFVWFYLVVANSQAGHCKEAIKAMEHFRLVYSGGDVFYVDEGFRWLDLCEEPEQMAAMIKVNKQENGGVANYIKQRLTVADSNPFEVRTRPVEISTASILYGVQVGAQINPSFTAEFKNLKNVESYVDENGVFRYVIGNLGFRSQAERLLDAVRNSGYPDAFIVDINNPEIFGKEVLSIGKFNVDEKIQGEVDFRVQIGAFAEKIPDEFIKVYLQVEGLEEIQEGRLTTLTVGHHKTYEGAIKERDLLREVGFMDAFVTSFSGGRRVPVRVAKKYLEEQKH